MACDDDNLGGFQAAGRARPRSGRRPESAGALHQGAVAMSQADGLAPAEAAEPVEAF